MFLKMCRSKIHRATVTEANLHYVGSITIGKDLLELSGILPGEAVQVVDIDNGNRLETYVIQGPEGTICLNGAAARLVQPGDKVIIMAFCWMTPEEARDHRLKVVLVDQDNRPTEVTDREDHGTIF
ncbi:aspartate 1-decarboxylase [Thermanaerovibrio acidaminovorans]|uniref:Aspartate 1-decarboxylase n=1 Tax=Thermanaerovibrio acidaminovorans (strain ATCC 49978 / DSM 6589 / Su883) TaxID=525903 RepID=D1B8U8_THEAS|nr:aspartate 1-decarboxylase [Thermanaerovibrio acidaminovorans]ACZ18701.1 aspartate 1-decarboxylase [Thermanaerovibrio acidaminovorans DSM 6589]